MTYPSCVSTGPNIGRLGGVTSNCDHWTSFGVRLSIDSSIETSMCWPFWVAVRWYKAAEMAPNA
jgi:hypothetical protein